MLKYSFLFPANNQMKTDTRRLDDEGRLVHLRGRIWLRLGGNTAERRQISIFSGVSPVFVTLFCCLSSPA